MGDNVVSFSNKQVKEEQANADQHLKYIHEAFDNVKASERLLWRDLVGPLRTAITDWRSEHPGHFQSSRVTTHYNLSHAKVVIGMACAETVKKFGVMLDNEVVSIDTAVLQRVEEFFETRHRDCDPFDLLNSYIVGQNIGNKDKDGVERSWQYGGYVTKKLIEYMLADGWRICNSAIKTGYKRSDDCVFRATFLKGDLASDVYLNDQLYRSYFNLNYMAGLAEGYKNVIGEIHEDYIVHFEKIQEHLKQQGITLPDDLIIVRREPT